MRRLLIVMMVAALLLVVSVVALAQADDVVGHFQAFVVDVTQETPVEVSIPVTLNDGSVITATAPLTVTVKLRVLVDGPGSAVVGDAEADVMVSPVDTDDAGALVDAAGMVYEVSPQDNIELLQVRAEPDYSEEFGLIGEVKNVGDGPLSPYTTVVVTVYDESGVLIGTETGYLAMDELENGETSPFQVVSSIPWSDSLTYKIQFSE